MTCSDKSESEISPLNIPSEILDSLSRGGAAWNSQDYTNATRYANEALKLAQQQKSVYGELGALHLLANIAFNESNDKLSRELHERLYRKSLEFDFLDGAASSLGNLALIDIVEGDIVAARDKYQKALDFYETSGNIEMANTIRSILSKDEIETVLKGIFRKR
jgi:hypothetical protein